MEEEMQRDATAAVSGKKHFTVVLLKVLVFSALLAVIFWFLGHFFQPVWDKWSTNNTFDGFYENPGNTVETIILGPSTGLCGVIPIELYEQYGICAYNLCGEAQPMLASYYWLKEAYRLHPESLSTVLLEPSGMTSEPKEVFYQKNIDLMHVSPVKFEAVQAYTDGVEDFFLHFFRLLEYHDRWENMTEDESQLTKAPLKAYLRGYHFSDKVYMTSGKDADTMTLPYIYLDSDAKPAKFVDESLEYADKIVQFCQEHGLRLVLFSSPQNHKRDSSFHNAIQTFAENHGVSYLDYSVEPLLSEIGHLHAVDAMDRTHLNYHGAMKLTSHLGRYLRDTCGNRDRRDDARYSFMEKQLSDYWNLLWAGQRLSDEMDVDGYLTEALNGQPYAVYLSVNKDGATCLTDSQREAFRDLGLEKLAALQINESYLAVIDNGVIVTEQTGLSPEGEFEPLSWQNDRAAVISGGSKQGKIASIQIGGTEYADNKRGINVVVWNTEADCLIDAGYFDTSKSSWRSGGSPESALNRSLEQGIPYMEMKTVVQKLFHYNRLVEYTRMKEAWEYFGNQDPEAFRHLSDGYTGYEFQQEQDESGTTCVIYDYILNRVALESHF